MNSFFASSSFALSYGQGIAKAGLQRSPRRDSESLQPTSPASVFVAGGGPRVGNVLGLNANWDRSWIFDPGHQNTQEISVAAGEESLHIVDGAQGGGLMPG